MLTLMISKNDSEQYSPKLILTETNGFQNGSEHWSNCEFSKIIIVGFWSGGAIVLIDIQEKRGKKDEKRK